MSKISIFWLLAITFPAYGMRVYEELSEACPAPLGNSISIGFHCMNDVDPNFNYVIASINANHKVVFERCHITWQPKPEQPATKIEQQFSHATDDTIVVSFKMPRR